MFYTEPSKAILRKAEKQAVELLRTYGAAGAEQNAMQSMFLRPGVLGQARLSFLGNPEWVASQVASA